MDCFVLFVVVVVVVVVVVFVVVFIPVNNFSVPYIMPPWNLYVTRILRVNLSRSRTQHGTLLGF